MAVAVEQEMKATVQEMRAKVVEAEAAVPLGHGRSPKEGKLGVMDYYNLQNIWPIPNEDAISKVGGARILTKEKVPSLRIVNWDYNL